MGPPEDGPSWHSQETSKLRMDLNQEDLIDVSYPHMGMDDIWSSDSPNWV